MPLSLEERERLAFIMNSPVHPLLAHALDAEIVEDTSQQHEIRMLKQELKDIKQLCAGTL